MNEFLEPFAKMLEAVSSPAAVRAIERGGPIDAMWAQFSESGFLDALVAEDAGGAGLSLADAGQLWALLGAHAVPVPVAETMVARALLAAAGVEAPRGPIAMATAAPGQAVRVCGGLVAAHVLVETGGTVLLVAAADGNSEPTGVHASLVACMRWDAPQGVEVARPAGGLRPVAALIRACQIAGASDRILESTVDYANNRIQFGKPIGRQQAVQQNLAVMAEDVVAARLAAQLGCASGFPPSLEAAATAKSVASTSATRVAAIAHAVHGAIGISEELDLQLLTRRLHEWRLADGSEGYWNTLLGTARLASADDSIDWVRARIFV